VGTTSEVSVSIAVDERGHMHGIIRALEGFAEVTVEPDLALVCAVDDGLMAHLGRPTRFLNALDGIPVRIVFQAASRRTITVVLADAHVPEAMGRLHEKFFPMTRGEAQVLLQPTGVQRASGGAG
jgi:aspartokinase